jgi:hypothetical protein
MRVILVACVVAVSLDCFAGVETCAGVRLGIDSRQEVLEMLRATSQKVLEQDDALKCKQPTRLIIGLGSNVCSSLKEQYEGVSVVIDEKSQKAIAVSPMFLYDADIHRRLNERLGTLFRPYTKKNLPAELRWMPVQQELTRAFYGDNVVVWLIKPSEGTQGTWMSNVIYALPKFLSAARTDLNRCQ